MARTFLLGIDIGNSGGKCLLWNVKTGETHSTRRSWQAQPVDHENPWWSRFDTETCLQELRSAIHELTTETNLQPHELQGIGITSLRYGVVLLDKQGAVLDAIPTVDARATDETLELTENCGPSFHQMSGHWPLPVLPICRLLWFKKQKPDLFAKVQSWLTIGDWLAFKLTGKIATDYTQANESGLLSLRNDDWEWNFADQVGLPRHLFPQLKRAGEVVGHLQAEEAAHLGLQPGITVVLGGGDTQAALLAANVLRPYQLGIVAGSTAPLQWVLNEPLCDPEARYSTSRHLPANLWLAECNAGPGGDALQWIADVLYPETPHPVARLFFDAQTSSPGAAGIFSNIGADALNIKEPSLPLGTLSFTHLGGVNAGERRPHFARAILEGMTFGLRANVEKLSHVFSRPPSDVTLLGGLSQNNAWVQMLTDVLGQNVRVASQGEASALGAAISAGLGARLFKSFAEAAERAAHKARVYTPNPQIAEHYRELFAEWSLHQKARAPADTIARGHALTNVTSAHSRDYPTQGQQFRPKVLVTAQMDEVSLETLRRFADVTARNFRDSLQVLTGRDLIEALAGYHVFITEVDVLDVEVLRECPDLKAVVACRGNAVNIDIAACSALSIPVLYAPGRNAEAVADLTLTLILMLLRKINEAQSFITEPGGEAGDTARLGQAFERFLGQELWNKTVGIVGMGAVGRAVTKRLLAFGAQVCAFDPHVDHQQILAWGATPISLATLLRQCDIVTLHAPGDVHKLISATELAQMKKGALLINTARASLIDEPALIEALNKQHIGGVGLDVFWVEPPPANHPLLGRANVVATPHIGGNTEQVAAHQGQLVAEGLGRLVVGDVPPHLLNPHTMANFSWSPREQHNTQQLLTNLPQSSGPAISDLEKKSESHTTKEPEDRTEKLGFWQGVKQVLQPAKKTLEIPVASAASPQNGLTILPVLKAFIEAVQTDTALSEFARGRTITSHYVLPDIQTSFFMRFDQGQVVAGFGEPTQTAEVRLKMKSDILDKTFSGEMNPTRAAMTGKLSFSGDTRVALSMQRIQKDIQRLYNEARKKVGISSIAVQETNVPVTQETATPLQSQDVRFEMAQIVKELYSLGVVTSTGGNVSTRIPQHNDLWITPSLAFKGGLRAEDMVRIRPDGSTVDVNAAAPSSERHFHCAIMRARPDVHAVVHAHAPKATALALAELPFLAINTEAAFIGEIPRVPFMMPGTPELADAIVQALGSASAVLMQNHGLVVAGASLRHAADTVEIIERTSQLILDCYAAGKPPPVLPDDIVALLRQAGRMVA